MAKGTQDNLLALLENLDAAVPVTVAEAVRAPAAAAVVRMLEVSA
jgi:quinolinate synthase